jgi:hypothetical protein
MYISVHQLPKPAFALRLRIAATGVGETTHFERLGRWAVEPESNPSSIRTRLYLHRALVRRLMYTGVLASLKSATALAPNCSHRDRGNDAFPARWDGGQRNPHPDLHRYVHAGMYIRVHPSIKSAFALRPRIAAIGGRKTTHYQPAWTAGSGSRIQINNGFLEPCEIVSGRWILTDFDRFSYTSKIRGIQFG